MISSWNWFKTKIRYCLMNLNITVSQVMTPFSGSWLPTFRRNICRLLNMFLLTFVYTYESTLFHNPEENMIHQQSKSPDLTYEISTSQITVPVEWRPEHLISLSADGIFHLLVISRMSGHVTDVKIAADACSDVSTLCILQKPFMQWLKFSSVAS
jgi:hypothetical protein